MKKQRPRFAKYYISENRMRLIINICFVVLGVVCGCIMFLYSRDTKEVASWAKEYVTNLENTTTKDIFISTVKDACIVCAIFYICSLFYIGEFLCPAYVFVRCMAYGFSNCLIITSYGFETGIMILLSLVPQMIFYISAFVIFSIETAKQSRFMGGSFDKGTKTGSFISYFLSTIFPAMLLLMGCVVEGFCSSHFILWCIKKF